MHKSGGAGFTQISERGKEIIGESRNDGNGGTDGTDGNYNKSALGELD